MFRGHHDSSQLSAALFGGGESNLPPKKQTSQFQYQNNERQERNYPQNSIDKRREWEDSLVSSGVFWGNDNDPKKPTPPTDKPPDPYRHQQQQSLPPQRQQYYEPFCQQPNPNKSPVPQCNQSLSPYDQSSNQQFGQQLSQSSTQQFGQQFQQPHQAQQSQISLHMQQGTMTPNPGTLALPIPIPNGGGMFQSAPTSPQYFPMQIPLGGPGFGNYPMFFVMSSQFPPDVTNKMSSSAPSTSDLMLQSVSSASSMDSRWFTPPDTRGSISTSQTQGSKSLSRAKWGEKGVGVGRLWNPEASTDGEIYGHRSTETLSPPQWADLSQSDTQVLPGAPNSRPGEKTHARGTAVVLDSQEMAERNRKQRQALETQRIIQQQLDEKKRLQQEEEEREKKEAALWEERVKIQQERERKEMEEEDRKKKEKEEIEERRQQKLMEAIQEAAEKAKRLKEETRYKNIINAKPNQDIYLEAGLETTRTGRQINLSNEPILEKDEEVEDESDYNNEVIDKKSEAHEIQSTPKLDLPDIVASAQVGTLSPAQKLVLLRALGIAPEFLLSSGVFDKSSFMSLLGESKGTGTSEVTEDEWGYTRNVTITPTKFRTSRDCGVQCDGYSSDVNYSEKRTIRRRTSKRQKSKEEKETPRSSPEDKPQWGRHRSERPYRKQSEKDPYQGRRFRRKPVSRSISVSDGRESNTDQDSDHQTATYEGRRRRKTWGESLQESLSSDLSRSPSPKSRKGPKINLPRGPPPIKQPLTPSLQQEKLYETTSSGTSQSLNRSETKKQEAQISNHRSNNSEHDKPIARPESKQNEDESQQDAVQRKISSTEKQPFRSTSPPVPAIAGTAKFDIPEYPPGFQLPPKQPSSENRVKSATKNVPTSSPESHVKGPEFLNEEEPPKCPLIPPDGVARSRQMSLPNIARKREEQTEEEVDLSKSGPAAIRRASLTSVPRMNPEHPTKINNITRPSSNTSLPRSPPQRPVTPRRLPPLNDQSPPNEENSPFIPKENNQSRTVGLGPEDEDRITPVEVTTTPRVSNHISLSPTTESIVTLTSSPGSRSKKDSSDSGISVDVSRPSSASSQIEEVLGASNNSYGYSYLKSSTKEPKDLTVPLPDPDNWIILRSLSPARQNFWRHSVLQAGSKSTS